jgi:hypothetical protein
MRLFSSLGIARLISHVMAQLPSIFTSEEVEYLTEIQGSKVATWGNKHLVEHALAKMRLEYALKKVINTHSEEFRIETKKYEKRHECNWQVEDFGRDLVAQLGEARKLLELAQVLEESDSGKSKAMQKKIRKSVKQAIELLIGIRSKVEQIPEYEAGTDARRFFFRGVTYYTQMINVLIAFTRIKD